MSGAGRPGGSAAVSAGGWSVVIPTRNTRTLTCRCLESLEPLEGLQRIVVDDASDDGTLAEIERRFTGVEVVRFEENAGFTAAVNAGLARAGGHHLLLLNSDTEVPLASWPPLLRAFESRPGLGIAGAQLVFPDGDLQWSGGAEPTRAWLFALASGLPQVLAWIPGYDRFRRRRRQRGAGVDWVTGAAMAFRRVVWDQVGPFDTRYRFYCQDLAFCVRARKAEWEVAILPEFRVVHHQGATIGGMTGAAGRQNPELLWSDLALWALDRHREAGARTAIRAMRRGARLRLWFRAVAGLFRFGGARERWSRDSLSYRRALDSLENLADEGSSR